MDALFDRHVETLPFFSKLLDNKVGHHHDKHVPFSSRGKTNVNRSQFQMGRLTVEEGLLHGGKILIVVVDGLFCCGFQRKIAFQYIAAIENDAGVRNPNDAGVRNPCRVAPSASTIPSLRALSYINHTAPTDSPCFTETGLLLPPNCERSFLCFNASRMASISSGEHCERFAIVRCLTFLPSR